MISPSLLGVIASAGGERDSLFSSVVLYVRFDEGAGVTPVDYSANAIVPTTGGLGSVGTGVDAASFTGRALSWATTDGYLLYTKTGGYLPSSTSDFCVEVWGDIDTKQGANGSFANGRNDWLISTDPTTGRQAAFSAQGSNDNQCSYQAAATTATAISTITGDLSALGFTRLTRNHYVIQRLSGVCYYYFNGVLVGTESPSQRNFSQVYIGNIGSSGFYTAGKAECLRITVGQRYPIVALVDGLPATTGERCFNVPTAQFPRS